MTFRVMSENSDPSSWQHPGLTPVNIMKEVGNWIDQEINKVIKVLVEEM